MKYKIFSLSLASLLLFSCTTDNKEEEVLLETIDEQASYLVGYDMGTQIKNALPLIENKAILHGVKTALSGEERGYSDESAKRIVAEFINATRSLPPGTPPEQLQQNLQAGIDYMAKLATKEGVNKTEEGIFYRVLTAGAENGASPNSKQTIIRAHYEGRLLDGTIFDSSYKRGQPAEFALDKVIKGWTIIVQKMKVGDVWEVTIPAEFAYGSTIKSSIPGNSTLIFKIELLAIVE